MYKWIDLTIRKSWHAFPVCMGLTNSGSPYYYLRLDCMYDISAKDQALLHEIIPPKHHQQVWYNCNGTLAFWRFDYKEKIFDALVLYDCFLRISKEKCNDK